MDIRITLRKDEREDFLIRFQQAYARGELRLIKRMHALLSIIEGKPIAEVAEQLKLSLQTIYKSSLFPHFCGPDEQG